MRRPLVLPSGSESLFCLMHLRTWLHFGNDSAHWSCADCSEHAPSKEVWSNPTCLCLDKKNYKQIWFMPPFRKCLVINHLYACWDFLKTHFLIDIITLKIPINTKLIQNSITGFLLLVIMLKFRKDHCSHSKSKNKPAREVIKSFLF